MMTMNKIEIVLHEIYDHRHVCTRHIGCRSVHVLKESKIVCTWPVGIIGRSLVEKLHGRFTRIEDNSVMTKDGEMIYVAVDLG